MTIWEQDYHQICRLSQHELYRPEEEGLELDLCRVVRRARVHYPSLYELVQNQVVTYLADSKRLDGEVKKRDNPFSVGT